VIGPVSVFEPVGVTVSENVRLPLLTVCEPLNVWLSNAVAFCDEALEPLLPHAARVSGTNATTTQASIARHPLIRSSI
jgi:hypothetical protein